MWLYCLMCFAAWGILVCVPVLLAACLVRGHES